MPISMVFVNICASANCDNEPGLDNFVFLSPIGQRGQINSRFNHGAPWERQAKPLPAQAEGSNGSKIDLHFWKSLPGSPDELPAYSAWSHHQKMVHRAG